MRNLTTIIVLGLGTGAAACGKKPPVEPTPATSKPEPVAADAAAAPADTAPAAVDTAPAAAAEVVAEAPGAAAEQCGRIIAKSWKAIQPGLTKLLGADPATLEEKFTKSDSYTTDFLEKCPAAPRSYRDCIEAGDNPLEYIYPCDANAPDPRPGALPTPRLPGQPVHLKPVALPAGAGADIGKRLVGTWESIDSIGSETWTIDAAGKVAVVRTRNGKPEEKRSTDDFSLTFENVGMATVAYEGSNKQTRSFYLTEDGKTFYSSGNLMWSVYPAADRANFVAKSGFDWVFKNGDACEVVTYLGSLVPAKCAFNDRDGGTFFDVEYQIPGKVRWHTTDPDPTKLAMPLFGTNLLAPELVKQEAFTKK